MLLEQKEQEKTEEQEEIHKRQWWKPWK